MSIHCLDLAAALLSAFTLEGKLFIHVHDVICNIHRYKITNKNFDIDDLICGYRILETGRKRKTNARKGKFASKEGSETSPR